VLGGMRLDEVKPRHVRDMIRGLRAEGELAARPGARCAPRSSSRGHPHRQVRRGQRLHPSKLAGALCGGQQVADRPQDRRGCAADDGVWQRGCHGAFTARSPGRRNDSSYRG
jgi:hypothetical protein